MVRNYALTKTDTHLHSLMVTMSQKFSVPQAAKFVSKALMSDKTKKLSHLKVLTILYVIEAFALATLEA